MAEHFGRGMAHAYILIEVEPTQTQRIVQQLSSIPSAQVHEVLGPYDIVMEVEAEGPEYITAILREKIRPLNGVVHTVTCPWID